MKQESNRKQEQNGLDGLDDNDRIEAGYYLSRFYKSLSDILINHRKPLSWLVKHAGRSKPWWGSALKDAKRKPKERSAIVIRGRDIKTIVLIASLLDEGDDIASKKLAARLEILQAQSALNAKINAYIKLK